MKKDEWVVKGGMGREGIRGINRKSNRKQRETYDTKSLQYFKIINTVAVEVMEGGVEQMRWVNRIELRKNVVIIKRVAFVCL